MKFITFQTTTTNYSQGKNHAALSYLYVTGESNITYSYAAVISVDFSQNTCKLGNITDCKQYLVTNQYNLCLLSRVFYRFWRH